MNDMPDPVPTDVRMLMAAANATPQDSTAAARPVVANPYLRGRVIEPPAPPRQATIGTSGNIVVPPLKIPTKCKERTRHGGARKNSGRKIVSQMHETKTATFRSLLRPILLKCHPDSKNNTTRSCLTQKLIIWRVMQSSVTQKEGRTWLARFVVRFVLLYLQLLAVVNPRQIRGIFKRPPRRGRFVCGTATHCDSTHHATFGR
jgi:hypothetical protein